MINKSKEDLSIKILGNVINKINYIINENKNLELLRNDISSLYDKLSKRFDKLEINNTNKQELKTKQGKYIGQVVNGLAEGKGIFYGFNGDRYEGEWKNDKKEGKGIYYFNDGDRTIGDYSNGAPIGKHVKLTKNGEVKTKNY